MKLEIFAWLGQTPIRDWVISSPYVWPTLECIHFVSLCVLMGGLLVIDLRLIGMFRMPCRSMASLMTRLALAAFAVNFATGFLFFAGNAGKYIDNPAFELKLVLIAAAGLNALYYRFRLTTLVASDRVTAGSIVVGSLSLALWAGVIVCGRMITFYAP